VKESDEAPLSGSQVKPNEVAFWEQIVSETNAKYIDMCQNIEPLDTAESGRRQEEYLR
jgi:hypothetical protein